VSTTSSAVVGQTWVESLDGWLTCVDAEEDDNAGRRVYCEDRRPELFYVKQASRKTARGQPSPYRLRFVDKYSNTICDAI
jgi:hypothetical protein